MCYCARFACTGNYLTWNNLVLGGAFQIIIIWISSNSPCAEDDLTTFIGSQLFDTWMVKNLKQCYSFFFFWFRNSSIFTNIQRGNLHASLWKGEIAFALFLVFLKSNHRWQAHLLLWKASFVDLKSVINWLWIKRKRTPHIFPSEKVAFTSHFNKCL